MAAAESTLTTFVSRPGDLEDTSNSNPASDVETSTKSDPKAIGVDKEQYRKLHYQVTGKKLEDEEIDLIFQMFDGYVSLAMCFAFFQLRVPGWGCADQG